MGAIALGAAVGLIALACAKPSESDSPRAVGPASATPTAPAATVASPDSAPGACPASALRVLRRGGDAGAGNRAVLLALRNREARRCTVAGFPTIALIDSTGATLESVRMERRPPRAGEEERDSVVTLAPGQAADFDVTYAVVPGESGGCPAGVAMEVGLPARAPGGAGTWIGRLRIPVRACGALLGETSLAPHAAAAARTIR